VYRYSSGLFPTYFQLLPASIHFESNAPSTAVTVCGNGSFVDPHRGVRRACVRRECRAVHHDRVNDGLIGRETARSEGTTKTARSVRRLQVVRRATSRRDCDKY